MKNPYNNLKKFPRTYWLPLLLLFVVLTVTTGVLAITPHVVHAQFVDPDTGQAPASTFEGVPGFDPSATGVDVPPGAVGSPSGGGASGSWEPEKSKSLIGNFLDIFKAMVPGNPLKGLENWILGFISNIILGIMALVVWAAGQLLDGSMWLTVHMNDILLQMPIVNVGWKIFRDLANLVFIFILLYIAIATILNVSNTRKMLVDVLITALLINFSLFFTKAIVDASNIIAIQFYDRIQTVSAGIPTDSAWQTGPSWTLFNALKIQTIYDYSTQTTGTGFADVLKGAGTILSDKLRIFGIALLGSIIMLIFAFILATAAMLLITRIVMLMFLMMISPLAFIARILPRTQSSWNKWLDSLINHAIYAPVFFVMMYVVLQAVGNGLPFAGGGTFNQAFSGVSGAFGAVLSYVFIIILLVMTIGISKSLSVHGASTVTGWGKGLGNWARDKTKQQSIGRPLRAITDSETFKNFARKNPTIGRMMYGGLKGVTGSKGLSGGYDQYRAKKDAKTKAFATHINPYGPGTPPSTGGPTPVPPVIPPGGGPRRPPPGGPATPPGGGTPPTGGRPIVAIPGGGGTTAGTGPGGRRTFYAGPPSPSPSGQTPVPPVIPPGGGSGIPGTPPPIPPSAGAPSGTPPPPAPPRAPEGGAGTEEVVKAIESVEKKIEELTEKIEGRKESGQNTTVLEDTLEKLRDNLRDLKETRPSVTQTTQTSEWPAYDKWKAKQVRNGVFEPGKGKKSPRELKEKLSELKDKTKGKSVEEIAADIEKLNDEIDEE